MPGVRGWWALQQAAAAALMVVLQLDYGMPAATSYLLAGFIQTQTYLGKCQGHAGCLRDRPVLVAHV